MRGDRPLLRQLFQHEHRPVPSSPEVRFKCPLCRKEGRKFEDFKLYVSLERGVGICHRCGWRGRWSALLQLFELIGRNPLTAPTLHELEQLCQAACPSSTPPPLHPLPPSWMPAWDHPVARAYLQGRGLHLWDAVLFGFGFCPTGPFANRIIIPICDPDGEYATFVARDVTGAAERKYLYPKGASVHHLLYNFHFWRRRRSTTLYLVEGVFDAVHLFPWGCASFGKHLSQSQTALLRSIPWLDRVVLMWDHDAWARTPELWNTTISTLSRYWTVTAVTLPRPDTDPTNYSLRRLHRWAGGRPWRATNSPAS